MKLILEKYVELVPNLKEKNIDRLLTLVYVQNIELFKYTPRSTEGAISKPVRPAFDFIMQ